jgi:hypothetical protein
MPKKIRQLITLLVTCAITPGCLLNSVHPIITAPRASAAATQTISCARRAGQRVGMLELVDVTSRYISLLANLRGLPIVSCYAAYSQITRRRTQ